ncbi:MAG: class I SAM-dependent methyltransferase [Leptospirales bacterium]|nr:class I SAM-dependent methyltransferase [Leptospirales bacterium]
MEIYAEKNNYFNLLARDWDDMANGASSEALPPVFDRINCPQGGKVLDAGCGTGVLFPHILKKIGVAGELVAVDCAAEMINTASEKFHAVKNISYRTAYVEELNEASSSFDAIIAFAMFPHVEDKLSALKKFRLLLKETGRLYIFHLSDTASLNEFHGSLSSPVCHDIMPGKDSLEGIMKEARFEIKEYIDHTGLNFIEAWPCT